MTRKRKIMLVAVTAAAALAVGGTAVAGTADNESEEPIRGEALDRASQVAIDKVGGGRVTDTEVGDEESLYEVEVTRGDGSQVDVQLDEGFNVVGSEADDERDGDR